MTATATATSALSSPPASLGEYVERGAMSAIDRDLLMAALRDGRSVVVFGRIGAGKTTLLRALAAAMDRPVMALADSSGNLGLRMRSVWQIGADVAAGARPCAVVDALEFRPDAQYVVAGAQTLAVTHYRCGEATAAALRSTLSSRLGHTAADVLRDTVFVGVAREDDGFVVRVAA